MPLDQIFRSFALGLICATASMVTGSGQAVASSTAIQCTAAIAVLEAGGEGRKGMAAVIDVVANRIADARFPNDACAVIRQKGQFQPVGEWPKFRRLLHDPAKLDAKRLLGSSDNVATALALAKRSGGQDLTGGALYFLNPRLMDRSHCPWFARLKKTTAIGEHLFLKDYAPGERRGAPALDCESPMIGSGYGRSLAASYANGLFDPSGPKTASKTPTRNQLRAWRQTGQLKSRQRELKKHFKPGWIVLE